MPGVPGFYQVVNKRRQTTDRLAELEELQLRIELDESLSDFRSFVRRIGGTRLSCDFIFCSGNFRANDPSFLGTDIARMEGEEVSLLCASQELPLAT